MKKPPLRTAERATLFGVRYTANTSVIPGTYSISSVYTFLLVVTDGYEMASSLVTVDRAFANLHLSGVKTGGVAFRGFSSSISGTPKLESSIPLYLYASVKELNVGWTALTPASGVTSPNSSNYGGGALQVWKIGPYLFIKGSVQVKSGDGADTLPSGYRPTDGNVTNWCPAVARIARLYVNRSGTLTLEWVRNISDGNEYTTVVWVDCNMDFWIS